jgi:RsiW-degrading membrane proteinase PrsW (M82 family)
VLTLESHLLWLKRIATIAGLLLFLPGLPLALGFFCITLALMLEGDQAAVSIGLISFTLMVIALGAGGVTFWQGLRSLQGKKSSAFGLPRVWIIASIFGLLIATGLFITQADFAVGLLFPPLLVVAAALPALLAVSWFTNQEKGDLTWRHGLVALAGGATIGVFATIVLELVFPAVVLVLVFDLAEQATRSIEALFKALAGEDIAAAITGPGFIYMFIQVAIIAPVVEELVKPLVMLPLVGRLSRRDAFLMGAMAGTGFAAIENVLYAGFGFYFWAGILLVRALGGAIHPLGSGLVALGWRDILRGEPKAWLNGLALFGLAVGMHALWNGGSLLVITLAGAKFFGDLPPEIDILGISAAGTTLALLIMLGLVALWLGRSIAQKTGLPETLNRETVETDFTLSNRHVAIWALACLVAIVPIGITGLRLLLR